jgi:8-oxo-dGTP pyrophosphatase MutT (NUDIX family)
MNRINKNEIFRALQMELTEEQRRESAMGFNRPGAAAARDLIPPPRLSAVMMILYTKGNDLFTIFTQRHDYGGVHSGQISFPGGKMELSDATMMETAIRETKEEIGIHLSPDQVLGQLDELYIPPSHFVVQPFVAWLDAEPQMQAEAKEVKEIISHPFHEFLRADALQQRDVAVSSGNQIIRVPSYDVQGRTLWGATAMMITEMCVRLKVIRL